MKIKRIALTTDFSFCAREAYAPTAELAARMGARIDLVHWHEQPFQYVPTGVEHEWASAHREEARKRLEGEAQNPHLKSVQVDCHLLGAYGADSLDRLVEEEHVDLVAQGSHGYTGLKHFLRGSFSERLLRRAGVPVLTFKSDEGAPFSGVFLPTKILFPHDFSPCSAVALDAVRFFANAYDAKVIVLNTWQFVPGYYDFHGQIMSAQLATAYQQMPTGLAKDLAAFAARELEGIPHETHVVLGDAAVVIASQAAAWGVDLICMATHGWTGLKHVAFGSVAERVARTAPCPTLTVRPLDKAMRDG